VPQTSERICGGGPEESNAASLVGLGGVEITWKQRGRCAPSGSLAEWTRKPIFFLSVPLRKPRSEWACQPVAFRSCRSVAPPGRFKRARILSFLEPRRGVLDWRARLVLAFRPDSLSAPMARDGLASAAGAAGCWFEGVIL
jgi:hypothetical protein